MGQEVKRTLSAPKPLKTRIDQLLIDDVNAKAPGQTLHDINLTIARGEIVGIAGVAGNGQTLLAEVIAGIHPLTSGDVVLAGETIARRTEDETLATPLGYIPEQPRQNGVVDGMSLTQNMRLRELAKGERSSDNATDDLLRRFNVNPPEPRRLAGTLSGGNLQKLVSARELGCPRSGILACYPTMGLDLAAIEMVYREMFAQAEAGAAVLWISEDLDDLLVAAHRIAVLREGRLVAIKTNDGTLSRDDIGALMTGMPNSELAA